MLLTVDGTTYDLESPMARTIRISCRDLTAEEFNAPDAVAARILAHKAVIARRQQLRAMCEIAQRRTLLQRAASWLDGEI